MVIKIRLKTNFRLVTSGLETNRLKGDARKMSSGNTTEKRIQFVTYLHAKRINVMSAVLFSLHSSIGLKRCRLLD